MGKRSIQRFIDGMDINSNIYLVMLFISFFLIIAMLFVNDKLKHDNIANNIEGQRSELVTGE